RGASGGVGAIFCMRKPHKSVSFLTLSPLFLTPAVEQSFPTRPTTNASTSTAVYRRRQPRRRSRPRARRGRQRAGAVRPRAWRAARPPRLPRSASPARAARQTASLPEEHASPCSSPRPPCAAWLHWLQSSRPFSGAELDYIASLDPFKDAEMLREELPSLMIREFSSTEPRAAATSFSSGGAGATPVTINHASRK
uniref:1-phosphatidylinositol 4-kinase n=3 Tax=Aegilops tauschii subsp. strangulata TaxID=200361 RepID=A0A452ZR48_AEGTS